MTGCCLESTGNLSSTGALLWVFILALLCVPPTRAEMPAQSDTPDRVVQAFTLTHRTAEEVSAGLRPLFEGAGVSWSVSGSQIVFRATSSALQAEVIQALRLLDRPRNRYRLELRESPGGPAGTLRRSTADAKPVQVVELSEGDSAIWQQDQVRPLEGGWSNRSGGGLWYAQPESRQVSLQVISPAGVEAVNLQVFWADPRSANENRDWSLAGRDSLSRVPLNVWVSLTRQEASQTSWQTRSTGSQAQTQLELRVSLIE